MKKDTVRVLSKPRWTKEEIEILKRYESLSREKLQFLLSNRSWRGIENKANRIGLRKKTQLKKLNTLTKDLLYNLYWVKRKSQKEIADLFNVTQGAIWYLMKKWNLKRRTRSEAESGKYNPFYGKRHSKEARKKNRIKHLGKKYPSEVNKKKGRSGIHNPFYGKKHSEEFKRRKSLVQREIAKRLWKNSDFVKKVMTARNIRPNREEKYLNGLIKRVDKGFLYAGDGKLGVTIGGRIPDWINSDRKDVIEYFGDYWHLPELNNKVRPERTSQATIEHYKKHGYRCLIIWRSELKSNEHEVIHNIEKFVRGD